MPRERFEKPLPPFNPEGDEPENMPNLGRDNEAGKRFTPKDELTRGDILREYPHDNLHQLGPDEILMQREEEEISRVSRGKEIIAGEIKTPEKEVEEEKPVIKGRVIPNVTLGGKEVVVPDDDSPIDSKTSKSENVRKDKPAMEKSNLDIDIAKKREIREMIKGLQREMDKPGAGERIKRVNGAKISELREKYNIYDLHRPEDTGYEKAA